MAAPGGGGQSTVLLLKVEPNGHLFRESSSNLALRSALLNKMSSANKPVSVPVKSPKGLLLLLIFRFLIPLSPVARLYLTNYPRILTGCSKSSVINSLFTASGQDFSFLPPLEVAEVAAGQS